MPEAGNDSKGAREASYRERLETLREELGPDSFGPDTPDWVVDAVEWVRKKWGDDPVCPYCHTEHWNVMGLTFLESSPNDPQVPDGARFPLFQVACTNCGHTVLVNARVSGVLGPADAEGE